MSSPVMMPDLTQAISFVTPFPLSEVPKLWEWMNEFRKFNFDDYGPQTLDEFYLLVGNKLKAGHVLCGVKYKGHIVGIVCFDQSNPKVGMFHGICFSKDVHGTGIPQAAVEMILEKMFEAGVEKVKACFFSDNGRVKRFFKKLGSVDEGKLRAETMRDGKPQDCFLVAIFKPQVQ